ncbi:LuxR C-terminal-related transcriptional regulator [Streptomyces sp. NPDC051129]|uniref:helix-turn-helix transcriptional regulator n=1 Tax=Streptomyces sp. NPDC051129 TaxID=3154639 RepID=UPI0034305A1C
MTSQTTDLLTDRARVIIEHLAKGDRRNETAHILDISRSSLRREIATACRKLNIPVRSTAAVNSAISKGIISLPPGEPVDLTKEQIDVLRLIAAGHDTRELAVIYGIATNTVKYHVGRIMKALGAKNRAHAVALGWQRGILGPPEKPPSSSAPAASPAG